MSKLKKWFGKRENKWILVGGIVALAGLSIPFSILLGTGWVISYERFEKLGVVGDFFGGTTIGLLSFASIIFVIAAITMQKEELSLQREEIEKNRNEYHLTNVTMKMQQFENTFFNMINLHHNLLKEIKIDESSARNVIQKFYKELDEIYKGKVFTNYISKFINEVITEDIEEVIEFARLLYLDNLKFKFLDEYHDHYMPILDYEGELVDDPEYDRFIETVQNDTNQYWIEYRQKHMEYFDKMSKDKSELTKFLFNINYKNYLKKEYQNNNNKYILRLRDSFLIAPLYELKVQAYEQLYSKHENLFGHYYRNLYHIVKLIQEQKFNVDREINEKEQRKYRGILRAQLSSHELLMIFYNIVYSKKGEKFKDLIEGTNFFDNHLIEKDFIWRNDKQVLKTLK
ncbi:hypothetical protein FZW96_11985 [Bacillus sp. BGMRC 2118]|nr:hypothetical protein FZW96_11985 [Bacillus sp. BGMRC 2118]